MSSFHFKAFLDGLYYAYNRRELVSPDPLMFLYPYEKLEDREIVGLVASCLAYGRVAHILTSVRKILASLGDNPALFLAQNRTSIPGLFKDFRHRFTSGLQIETLLLRAAKILQEYGSLEAFMAQCLKGNTLLEALNRFSYELEPEKKGFSLVPAPKDGSACKRLMLYLKWMTRHDEVDPGGWTVLKPCDLIMPIDTHIHNISLQLKLTNRKQADMKAALQITAAFAAVMPEDPTRYDFVLSRFGIRSGLDVSQLRDLSS